MSCRCCGNGSDCVGKRLNASFQIRNTSLIVRVFSRVNDPCWLLRISGRQMKISRTTYIFWLPISSSRYKLSRTLHVRFCIHAKLYSFTRWTCAVHKARFQLHQMPDGRAGSGAKTGTAQDIGSRYKAKRASLKRTLLARKTGSASKTSQRWLSNWRIYLQWRRVHFQ